MNIRIAILFVPSVLGLLWQDEPEISIIWSLAGSLFVAAIAQNSWFKQSDESLPITHRLLRPTFMYHFFFLGYHVLGGAVNALELAGYTYWGRVAEPAKYELSLNAMAQALMLLGHASVTAGMKLAGLRYDPPRYIIAELPAYGLLVLSLVCLGVGTAVSFVPSLFNLSEKIFQIASTAVLVEIVFAAWRRNFNNTVVGLLLLFLNLLSQILSGWKALVLWTMITLGALLYPLMPRRVLFGGFAFALFWALYLHPFGLVLRPLIWYEGVDRNMAIAISMNEVMNMSLRERLDNTWKMMVGRANDLYQFRKYLLYVPDAHPYYGLDLLKEAHLALMPRILWPEKPNLERVAMERVYDAGIVSEQAVVSAKSNFYQDAYLSGGWAAVVPASLLLGYLSILISRTSERLFGGYQIGTCLVFTSLFATTFNTAPNFLFLLGTVWTSLLVALAVFFAGRMTGWIVPARAAIRGRAPRARLVKRPLARFPLRYSPAKLPRLK
ncbi:MAG: hypothetical protein HY695_16050 [Deltaproteobacteria bacterium]|nr:hypothetical protein [Deltaproteobacteria bacterium]